MHAMCASLVGRIKSIYIHLATDCEMSFKSEEVKAMSDKPCQPHHLSFPFRSFSALRRIKTYLRTTMTQVSLNSLMVLHIHSDKTDSLNLYSIGDQLLEAEKADFEYLENL